VSSERFTGVAEPVISLAKQQYKQGHVVWLACIGGYTFEQQALQSGIQIFTELTLDRRLYPLNIHADYKRLQRFIEERRIDIVHSHLLHDNWLAASALRAHKRPHLLIRTMHRFEWPRRDPMHKYLFRKRVDHIITTSEAMRQRVLSRLGLPPEKVDVIFGGVDLERFNAAVNPYAIRDEFHVPHDAPVAGIVARLRKGRGHDWLLRTIPKALQRLPSAHFLIVGRGELKYKMREQVARMPERANVYMTGYRVDDLPEAYAAMNCSMFLGQGSEGTCRAILEAMACGRPVIGVADGGVGEIIRDGQTGLVVAQGDEQGLCDALVRMMSDLGAAAAMGRQARAECERRFTEENRTEGIMRVYRAAWESKYGRSIDAPDDSGKEGGRG